MKLDEAKLQEVVEKIAYQQFGAEQIDDLYAKMDILNDYVQEQLRSHSVNVSVCACEMPAKVKGKNECWRCKKPFKEFLQTEP